MLKLESRGEDVRTLQENLKTLGYGPRLVDGDFGEKTENAVIRFQETEGLLADGIVGTRTQLAIEKALREHVLEQLPPGVDSVEEHPGRLPFVRVPADVYRDGYDRFFLREDVAKAYKRARAEVLEAGGKITSSGAKRSLNANVSPSRSATSFHYTGRAFDLQVGSGMESPGRDAYVIVRDGNRSWRVYARAPGGKAMELKAITYRSPFFQTKFQKSA